MRSLDNYFTPRAAGDALPEIEELHIPDVAFCQECWMKHFVEREIEEALAALRVS